MRRMDPIEADAGPLDPRPSNSLAPSDNTTLTAVLTGLGQTGFAASFGVVAEGRLRCDRCNVVSSAADYGVASIRRLEGASDPDEMVSVVAAVCPSCGIGGVAVIAYGPMASEEDADASTALPRVSHPVVPAD